MTKLRIGRGILVRARDRGNLTSKEKAAVARLLGQDDEGGVIAADVKQLPLAFLRALLDDSRLTANQRAVVALHVYGMNNRQGDCEKVYAEEIDSPADLITAFKALAGSSPNCEYFLNGRWYPIVLNVQVNKATPGVPEKYYLYGLLSVCEFIYRLDYEITVDLFQDEAGEPRERTVLDVLQQFGLRALQTSPGEFNVKLLDAERTGREPGRLMLVSATVLTRSKHWWEAPLTSRALGTPEVPRQCVVEPELEVEANLRRNLTPLGQFRPGISRLPFVRVFSLDLKRYVYADVEDLVPYEFDTEAMGRLHLPANMVSVLERVFHTPVERLFGDLIRGKHGGIVVLASGRPGVGKTLTAEVYAEETRRPLYVLGLGELGTNVAQVEENLSRVFLRVARWNAVLQFDECEIFLAHRGEDLERSAIVGSFLRLLDYYAGILFLTSNRPEVIDHAVLSRVMLRLHYPDLDRAARAVVWRTMFQAAGLTLVEGSVEDLAAVVLNGRQIRNLTRLAKILHPDGRLTLAHMREVLRHGAAAEPAADPPPSQEDEAPPRRHPSLPETPEHQPAEYTCL
jgi:hypothetical protein